MAAIPPPLPTVRKPSSALSVLIWIAWVGVTAVADFLGFLMFAFADSPSSASAAKLMIVPVFIWFGVTFVAGIILLIFRGWWQIALAFALAVSPPFLVFVGYNLLSGAGNVSSGGNVQPAAPPVRIQQRHFEPAPTSRPTQPDFQKAVRDATSRSKSD